MPHLRRLGLVAIAAAATLAVSGAAMGQGATDYLGVPGPIELAGVEYELAWSSQPAANYTKQEYLPAGQVPEAYESMVMVEFLASDLTPVQMASAQVDMLNQRKATDPLVNMSMMTNQQSGEVLLDFIVSSKDAAGEYIVEWNGYRYASARNGDGEGGGLLFGVSHRAYGNEEAKAFLQSLGEFKSKQIDALAAAALPEL
jgi:hypothetical protein